MNKLLKTLGFMLLITLIGTSFSCNDTKNKTNSKVQIEDNENFAGSSKREDICELITENDVRSVFALSQEIEIEKDESHNAICKYVWEVPNEAYVFYSVSLNFARGEKRSSSQIDDIWKSQNDALYKRHQLQEVSGVGDKASWSKLGGGQLRVASDGLIFYVGVSIIHATSLDKKEKSPEDIQKLIDKASVLANLVIRKL